MHLKQIIIPLSVYFISLPIYAAELKIVKSNINAGCYTAPNVAIEMARNEALKQLGDNSQYQQVMQWDLSSWLSPRRHECSLQMASAVASFVEKEKASEEWEITLEREETKGLYDSDEAGWANAVAWAQFEADRYCNGKANSPYYVEHISRGCNPDFGPFKIKASFVCIKN